MKSMKEKFTMITAKEARTMIEGDADKAIKELDGLIRTAVSKGKDHIRVPYEMVTINGYSIKFKNPVVEAAIVNAGYNVFSKSKDFQFVDVWFEVDRQFVDVWLEVSW